MTHREARRKLGSRTNRRVGTKTKVIPGAGGKRPIKYRHVHRKGPSLAAQVAKLVRESKTVSV